MLYLSNIFRILSLNVFIVIFFSCLTKTFELINDRILSELEALRQSFKFVRLYY